jgi:predicted transcriptional regulator
MDSPAPGWRTTRRRRRVLSDVVALLHPLLDYAALPRADECMALMTDRRIRHVPVVDGGEVVGVVSIGDLVKFKSKRQSFEIQYLTDYITAG